MAATTDISINEVIEKWLDITIDRFHQALDEFEIGRLDGKLWRSIMGEIIRSGGDVERVIVKFAQYGRFVDMGVGRGVPIGSRKALGDQKFFNKRNSKGQLHKYLRKPKPWYSRTKTREISRLREIMASSLVNNTIGEVQDALNNGFDLKYAA